MAAICTESDVVPPSDAVTPSAPGLALFLVLIFLECAHVELAMSLDQLGQHHSVQALLAPDCSVH